MIQGQIYKILTQKDNDWGRYVVDEPAGKQTLCVGIIPHASIGMTVTLEGGEEKTIYGNQFKITAVLSTEEDKCAGARCFLSNGYIKGIGLKKANAIISMYGNKSVDLFETPEGRKKLCRVKGLSSVSIDKALASYSENRKYKDIVMFLNGTGTRHQVEAIYEKYGDGAVSILKKNPYRLQIDLDGFGFARADSIAQASGIKPNSIYRIMAAIKFSIEQAQSNGGHCYLTVEEIRKGVAELLVPAPRCEDVTDRVVNNAMKDWPDSKEKFIKAHKPAQETVDKIQEAVTTRKLINEGISDALSQAITEEVFVNDDGRIYTKAMYDLESNAARTLAAMTGERSVRFVEPSVIEKTIREVEDRKTKELKENGIGGAFEVTKEQRDAVYLALMHRISIISGGPGRGKTAISEIVAHSFLSAGRRFDKDDIIMLAPTGRAAQRITESTGYPAMTAHRAILQMKTSGDRPEGKLVLVDETSMVDIFLLTGILKFARKCNLIFVGDVDQIASVGPGKVLKDMIDCGKIPCILLKQGHRNSGTIAKNSELINAGMKLREYTYDEHFVYIPCTAENISDTLIRDYIAKVQQYGIQNVMLCSAMRERGSVSVNKLNRSLQQAFTAGRPQADFGEGRFFRVGDRVMQTKNDYTFTVLRNGRQSAGIFNGEKGTVAKVTKDEITDEYRLIVLFDDGSIGGYTKATAFNLTLAYATTLHKCQGSEAACMMMAYTYGDYMLLNRSLFYTGETRAKKEFRFYGEEQYRYGRMLSAFDIAVGKTNDASRNTALAERIRKEIDG